MARKKKYIGIWEKGLLSFLWQEYLKKYRRRIDNSVHYTLEKFHET
jgi:hypothetical protein